MPSLEEQITSLKQRLRRAEKKRKYEAKQAMEQSRKAHYRNKFVLRHYKAKYQAEKAKHVECEAKRVAEASHVKYRILSKNATSQR